MNSDIESDSFRAKLARADEHLKALDGAIRAFESGDPCHIVVEADANGHEGVVRVVTVRKPDARIAVVFGDAIHNMRSALDHLAYQLTECHPGPSPKERDIEFPIRINPPGPKDRQVALSGMHPTARAIIQGLQPHKAWRPPRESPLFKLHKLWNRDKHSSPLATAINVSSMNFAYLGTPVTIDPMLGRRPLVAGTEVARFPVTPDFDPEVDVEGRWTYAVELTVPPVVGEHALLLLSEIRSSIEWDVVIPLAGFLGRGAGWKPPNMSMGFP